jgi:hypothetical protein
MFSLKTSAPEIYRLSMRFSDELEGPMVARIFVERFLFIDDDLQVTETLPLGREETRYRSERSDAAR